MTTEQQNRLNYLKRLVALRVDEYTEGENIPDLPSGDIDLEIANATRSILRRASRNAVMMLAKNYNDPDLNQTKRGSTIIPFPHDYVRFLQASGRNYKQPVTGLLSNDSQLYKLQVYPMKRTTVDQPYGFLVPYGDGRAVELFPSIREVESFLYVPEVLAYDLPEEFEDAVVWRTVLAILVIMRSQAVNAVMPLSETAIQEIGLEVAG